MSKTCSSGASPRTSMAMAASPSRNMVTANVGNLRILRARCRDVLQINLKFVPCLNPASP